MKMKRLIECTMCGKRHQAEFTDHNEWLSIKKACCPVCTKDLPPDSDSAWDDPNYTSAAQTTHRPVIAELMHLGTHDGLVGDLGFWNLTAVMNFTPFIDTWDSVAGSSERSLSVTAILADNTYLPLRQSIDCRYADYRTDYKESAPTIGEQIVHLNVKGLEFVLVEDDQNGFEEWREYLPLEQIDWAKVRRRIEDALRKTGDPKTLFQFAQKLGIKLD
jgi:hypothetical protein